MDTTETSKTQTDYSMFLDIVSWHQSFWSIFLPFMEHLSWVTDLACCNHLGRNEEPDFKMSCPLIGGGGNQHPNRNRQIVWITVSVISDVHLG